LVKALAAHASVGADGEAEMAARRILALPQLGRQQIDVDRAVGRRRRDHRGVEGPLGAGPAARGLRRGGARRGEAALGGGERRTRGGREDLARADAPIAHDAAIESDRRVLRAAEEGGDERLALALDDEAADADLGMIGNAGDEIVGRDPGGSVEREQKPEFNDMKSPHPPSCRT
jgi:hypothetical protein